MIFTITSINKSLDLYEVISDTNEKKFVTANQILSVLINGYEFTNAKLTRKGFAVSDNGRTKYVQLEMSRQTAAMVLNRLEIIHKAEEMKKAQMTQAVKAKPKVAIGRVPINSRGYSKNILYRCRTYLSPEAICKEFGADVNRFKKLYAMGYSVDECLGNRPLRPESELKSRKDLDKMLDSLDRQRGDM